MIEDIKELAFDPNLQALGEREPFSDIEIAPRKVRTTERIAAEVSELTVTWIVAAKYRRSAESRIQPLAS